MNRRHFLQTGGVLVFAAATARCRKTAGEIPFRNIEEASVAELQSAMQRGDATASSITLFYLDRIERLDKNGPKLRAVIETNPDARSDARRLDEERKQKGPRGPMHGIPVLIKDNIDTAGRMQTTAGSLALVGSPVGRDAFVVRRLREAGAVILGKTNLTEWANFRSTRSTSGWSGRGGLTKNPYALDRNASGSSSGSAAAVSANLCAAAVGTETDGSVTSPSSVNGIVGIKPTLGLISRSGIVPIAHSQDTAGPMARTVSDAAVLLGVMAGTDPDDGSTLESASRGSTDYTRFLDPDGLRGTRVGLARNLFGFHDRVDVLMEEAVGVMRRCGAVVVDPVEVPNTDELGELEWDILLYEFKADLNAYLAKRRAKPHARSLEALIAFNQAHRDAEMPYFGQEIFTQSQAKGPLTEKAYLLALERARRLSRREGIDAVLRKHGLDAVAAPTAPPAWVTDLVDGDHYLGGTSTPAAVAGYPHVTLPMGFVFGLPIGVSFFAGAWSEPKLIRIAYAFEQASRARKPPRFLPSVKMA